MIRNQLTVAARRRQVAPIGVIVIVMALMTAWWQVIGRVPDIKVPTPILPVPNAHDDFIAAAHALVNGDKVDYASMTVHISKHTDDHPYTLAQKQSLIAQNTVALRLLRKGLGEPYWAPPVRSFNTLFPYYVQFRTLARLLALEQQTRAQAGDWRGAADSGLDGLQMGVQIPHGAVLIGDLVGIACESIARRSLWDAIDHLSALEARVATRRLESIIAHRNPYSETMREEKWMALPGLQEEFRHSSEQNIDPQAMFQNLNASQQKARNLNGASKGSTILQNLEMVGGMILRGGLPGILYRFTQYMDTMIIRADKRYGAHTPLPPASSDLIVQMMSPIFMQTDFKDAFVRTEDDLLLVSLALHAYRVEHGRYPETLEALTPEYLAAIPQDLFARSGTLRYRLNGKSYLLYSVGPDGVDNAGTPIDDPTRSTPPTYYQRHQVDPQSLGDIVAGVNR